MVELQIATAKEVAAHSRQTPLNQNHQNLSLRIWSGSPYWRNRKHISVRRAPVDAKRACRPPPTCSQHAA
eukprot:6488238-Amphidinium_carterae.2